MTNFNFGQLELFEAIYNYVAKNILDNYEYYYKNDTSIEEITESVKKMIEDFLKGYTKVKKIDRNPFISK